MMLFTRMSDVGCRVSADRASAAPHTPRPLPVCALAVALPMVLWAAAAAAPAAEVADPNADWPCIQHKVDKLTAAQMWDGPPVDDLTGWRENKEIAKLVPRLISRRLPMEKAAEEIEAFAAAQPPEKRDKALTLLFAGVLSSVNADRAVVISGIERFQRRQRARAAEIERQGEVIRKRKEKTDLDDPEARKQLTEAVEAYNWDVRVFTDRQQSLPLACEIPVLIEQRLFALAREIRQRMQN